MTRFKFLQSSNDLDRIARSSSSRAKSKQTLETKFSFTPETGNRLYGGTLCKGECPGAEEMQTLRNRGFTLSYLLDAYKHWKDSSAFFVPFFDKLAGTDALRKQVVAGMQEKEIRKSWKKALSHYKKTRKKYLLYRDFEN